MIGPVIGFLLSSSDYAPDHMNKYSDRFGIYQKVGGLIYAFSENTINWVENKVTGLYFNIETKTWDVRKFSDSRCYIQKKFHSIEKYN